MCISQLLIKMPGYRKYLEKNRIYERLMCLKYFFENLRFKYEKKPL